MSQLRFSLLVVLPPEAMIATGGQGHCWEPLLPATPSDRPTVHHRLIVFSADAPVGSFGGLPNAIFVVDFVKELQLILTFFAIQKINKTKNKYNIINAAVGINHNTRFNIFLFIH